MKYNFSIERLGKATTPSPIALSKKHGDHIANFVRDDECIIYDTDASAGTTVCYSGEDLLEKAGPREMLYFSPEKVKAAIVTCGGLCPGLNSVIRAIVMTLWYQYGSKHILGIRYGYQGFLNNGDLDSIELTPDIVEDIHRRGGTILGSSRGNGEKTAEIVDTLIKNEISVLFTIGGDGTQKGALAIQEEVKRRGKVISVVGIPKTIDNDLSFVQRSFGFETAVAEAVDVVSGAHIEAHDAVNGISIVKLMGRESGYIAAYTAIAANDVNIVLVPEVPFDFEGPKGLLEHLKFRIEKRKHALIIVAEGVGQDLIAKETGFDASGNKKLADIGLFLKEKIGAYFKSINTPVTLRYIDPGYIIRSVPAAPGDAIYCARLGANAVHAAMSGRTGMIISLINNQFVHVPIALAVSTRNKIDPESALWRDVIQATGQPPLMVNC
ncbi:MAG TPA: ATP-dependent 6-phosphofructokinase [Chitinispirillaceae bacterium]|nr:ATP-dependent 6-phosphofructokinase [Chitinispirillaceae bacterium]